MPFNFYHTHTLLKAVNQMPAPASFLRDRYFPTNDIRDIFATEDVLVEYRDGTRKLAPFVAPRKGGVTILRKGASMQRYTPPFIAPARLLTLDELNHRGFGEALYTKMTPEQRQHLMLLQDVEELDALIVNREEEMAAQTMLNNGCIMRHIADDPDRYEEMEIRFYEGSSNPAQYTPTVKWDQPGAKILADIAAMARMLSSRGMRAEDLICSPDAADTIVNDPQIKELLGNRRYELGSVAPKELAPGAAIMARLNVGGRLINVISYDMTYTDESGKEQLYIPAGKCILTAPKAGRTLYGAVTQIEQTDNEFHTYATRRVPKYFSDADSNIRKLTLSSRPLLIPNNKNPWICATVTGE